MICMSHLKLLEPASAEVTHITDAGGEETSDGALVLRALSGERRAEELLYRRHAAELLGTCTRLLRSKASAEDVVQDAFILAFARLSSLKEPGSFRAWIARIATRLVHRRWRRAKMRRLLGFRSADGPTLASIADPRLPADVRLQLADLDRALTQLDPADRMAWMLRHVEGQGLSEVAMSTGCSLATVKRRIRRADERVRAHVELEGGAGAE